MVHFEVGIELLCCGLPGVCSCGLAPLAGELLHSFRLYPNAVFACFALFLSVYFLVSSTSAVTFFPSEAFLWFGLSLLCLMGWRATFQGEPLSVFTFFHFLIPCGYLKSAAHSYEG